MKTSDLSTNHQTKLGPGFWQTVDLAELDDMSMCYHEELVLNITWSGPQALRICMTEIISDENP